MHTEFTIVKGVAPHRQPKPHKSTNTKYERLIKTMEKLKLGDHVVVAESELNEGLKAKVANVKHRVKVHLGKKMARRTFEYKAIPAAIHNRPGYDIIIRRVS